MAIPPQMMAAALSGQMGANPTGAGMLDRIGQTVQTDPMGSGPLGVIANALGLGGPDAGGPDGSARRLYMLAGAGASKLLDSLPKVFNGLMDLQQASQGNQEAPGALEAAAEPPPPGPPGGIPPGMPPPAMPPGMPPPGMAPQGLPPGAAQALMQMVMQRRLMGG